MARENREALVRLTGAAFSGPRGTEGTGLPEPAVESRPGKGRTGLLRHP